MIEWKTIESRDQIEEIIQASRTTPVVIYKHSNRCGASLFVRSRLEKQWKNGCEVDFYFLDLVSYRDVSNEVADRFGVRHESPQILLIRNGRSVFDTSHSGVSAKALKKALDKTSPVPGS
jgi:bacillithiol system protein YtxJ